MTASKRIITPFANSGDKNTIPDTAPGTDNGYANYPAGFPPSNSVDPALGGYYVKRDDFNGVLFDVTNILKNMAEGLLYTYDATYATSISGYPVDAVLAKSSALGFWLNTTAGNTTNPDTGGAGWVDFSPKAMQNESWRYVTATGTADAITTTYVPAYAAWVDGMTFFAKITAANTTTTPTVSPNGLTAKTIVKINGVALKVGDLAVGMIAEFKYSSTLDKVLLQNPATSGGLINYQIFSTVGTATYTPTSGTNYVIVECVGGGAAGGGAQAAPAGSCSAGGGGSAGAYGKSKFTSAFSGVTVTVGAGGTPGSIGNNPGGNGGTSSFGALLSCPGGVGGAGGPVTSVATFSTVGSNGSSSNGSAPTGANILAITGEGGEPGYIFANSNKTGKGGGSVLGSPGRSFSGSTAGISASGYGAGGSGAGSVTGDNTNRAGGAGSQGVVIVWEYS